MSKNFYVTEGAKVKCTMGLVNPKELKGTSHGVFRMNGNTALPVLNGMDNIPENIDVPGGSYNIPSFCKCKSLANIDIPRDHPELAANPALITEIEANAETVGTCNCRPLFPAPWINGATQTITGDFATLTSDCMIVCAKGFGVVSIVEEAKFKGNGSVKRPSWRQSELDAAKDFPEYLEQKSFIDKKEVPYGTKGSVRPDLYKEGFSIDVKNYNIETASGRSNLARNIEKQYYQRLSNLLVGTNQSVLIDIRGQNVSQDNMSALYNSIMERTNNGIKVKFKTN